MNSLKSGSDGTVDRNTFPNRPQSVGGIPILVRDASTFYPEKPAYSSPDIDVIDSDGLFHSDEVVIGFGKPNVFLLIPLENSVGYGSRHERFAAKSLWRAPSEIQETRGRIQSSIFIILKNLSSEVIQHIRDESKNQEGSKHVTCVKANMEILNGVGFTLGNGENLNQTWFTVPLFQKILEYGLEINGTDIEIETIKTTRRYLENQLWATTKATIMTPFRHISRAINKNKTQKGTEILETEQQKNVLMKHADHHKHDITLQASSTRKLAIPLRLLWGAHTVFSIKQDRVNIEDYLNQELIAYPDENPDLLTKMKKNIFFNKYVVGCINNILQNGRIDFGDISESDIYNLFEVDSIENGCKYNIVSSNSGSMLMKVDIGNKIVDWILTKHVLISNYAKKVRFAGEVWKDEQGVIWINRNSGTYKPTEEQLSQFIQYIKEIFPSIDIRADSSM